MGRLESFGRTSWYGDLPCFRCLEHGYGAHGDGGRRLDDLVRKEEENEGNSPCRTRQICHRGKTGA